MLLVCDAGKHRSLIEAVASLDSPHIEFDLVRTFDAADAALDAVAYDLCLIGSGPDTMPEAHLIDRIADLASRLPVALLSEQGERWEVSVVGAENATVVLAGHGFDDVAIARIIDATLCRKARTESPCFDGVAMRDANANSTGARRRVASTVTVGELLADRELLDATQPAPADAPRDAAGPAPDASAPYEEMRERDETYRVIAESASDPIVTIDDAGIILFANRATERMFRYSRAEMIGSHFTMLMPAALRTQWAAVLYNFIETGIRMFDWNAVAMVGRRKDGGEFPVEISFGSDHHTGKRCFTGIVRDISGRKRIEQERDELLTLIDRERARLDAVLRMVPVGIWESEAVPGTYSQRNTFVNKYYEDLLGYTAEEWSSRADLWLEIMHPEDRARMLSEVRADAGTPDAVENTFRMITKDGRTRWLNTNLVLRRDGTGAVTGTTGYAVDITDRVLADERYRRIVETSQEGIYIIDLEGSIQYANSRTAEMFGYASDERVGGTIFDLLPPESVATVRRYLDESKRGVKTQFDIVLKKKNGDSIWCLISTSPIYDADGNVAGNLGMLTNITKRKLAEEALQEAHDKLEARVVERTAELARMMHRLEDAYVAQKRFIADASHDIRTPLTSVRAELDLLLQSQEMDPPVRNALERVFPQIKRLSILTDDLLMLATLDSNETFRMQNKVHVEDLLLESIVDLSTAATERDICWNINFDGLVEIDCDAAALKRAFANILQNAIKYAHAGTVIDVEMKGSPVDVTVSVKDCGAGIRPEDMPHIFDRFYRGDQTRSTQGTGLGLAIVKAVIEGHGGRIAIASEVDAGPTVTITVPRGERGG
jgi:PAS domain S-box-containing protein